MAGRFAFLLVFVLSGCAGRLTRNPAGVQPPYQQLAMDAAQVENRELVGSSEDVSATPEAPPEAENLEKVDKIDQIVGEAAKVLADMDDMPEHIPLELNRNVAKWIHFFTVRERGLTQRYLERGAELKPHIEQILRDNDVPAELFYLAMIESGFVPYARSRAKAVGVWQFMKGTGMNYGLAVDGYQDERRNWIKSTEAAAAYLKDLNNIFQNWYLALAAYNAGEHRIVRSIMRGKTRDFWILAERKTLPRETMNYVPKFIAAQIVGRNPEKYGFTIDKPAEDKWGSYTTVSVPSGVRFQDLAKVTGVPLETLRQWNQDMHRGFTPPVKGGLVDIYVPQAAFNAFEDNRVAISRLKPMNVARAARTFASERVARAGEGYEIYVVRRGDNLDSISRALGISLRTLKKINGLRKSRIHPGQRLKYFVGASASAKRASNRSVASSARRR
ncbi:MAG: transglycosylase SLT domain-containing protein [Bdellovibrionales bacterium]|nr:transglycosylase SLT domain-containing protein [Bdellovibrionales bacterium]